jgi:hypothetical protein
LSLLAVAAVEVLTRKTVVALGLAAQAVSVLARAYL